MTTKAETPTTKPEPRAERCSRCWARPCICKPKKKAEPAPEPKTKTDEK